MSTTVAEVRNLSVAIDGHRILHDINAKVDAGEFLAVLGHNGSGKSTLIRTVLGLQRFTGAVELFGTPLEQFRDWHRIGYLSQGNDQTTGVPASVLEVVLSGTMTRHRWIGWPRRQEKNQAFELIDRVGLRAYTHRAISELSGGQRQRARIARALVGDPDLLVMDEPTVGVDAQSLKIFADILDEQITLGRSVIMVTHELGVVRHLVDRTITLEAGHICATCDGPAELHAAELREHYEAHHANSHTDHDGHHVPEHEVRPVVSEGPIS